jgi:hypothetical protein
MYGLENIICRSQSTRTINYQIEGGAFRSEEFIQERGAPCHMDFTLSADERGEKQADDDDGGGGEN